MEEQHKRISLEFETGDLALWLTELFDGLRVAMYGSTEQKSFDRRTTTNSLESVLKFLRNFGGQLGVQGLHMPLTHLQIALEALDEGQVLPLLVKSKREAGGRPRDSRAMQEIWGMSAYFFELLKDLRSEQEAAQAVADVLDGAGFRLSRQSKDLNADGRRGRITKHTVMRWHKQMPKRAGERCNVVYLHMRSNPVNYPLQISTLEHRWRFNLEGLRLLVLRTGYADLLPREA